MSLKRGGPIPAGVPFRAAGDLLDRPRPGHWFPPGPGCLRQGGCLHLDEAGPCTWTASNSASRRDQGRSANTARSC